MLKTLDFLPGNYSKEVYDQKCDLVNKTYIIETGIENQLVKSPMEIHCI